MGESLRPAALDRCEQVPDVLARQPVGGHPDADKVAHHPTRPPLTVDEVAAITPKRLRDWSRKHSADGTSRKKSPFWMDQERSSGLPMASTPGIQEEQNPKPDPHLDPPLQMTYSHYNLERDGMSRLLILNSLALSVALFCSTSILLPGASTMSMAITGLGALLSAASLALLLTNLNQHSNSGLNWFDQHSTKLEVLMLLYLSGLLGLNAGGYIDLGWSRWLVISSQTICWRCSPLTRSSTSSMTESLSPDRAWGTASGLSGTS